MRRQRWCVARVLPRSPACRPSELTSPGLSGRPAPPQDELVPNKKKVGEVRDWLSEALPPLFAGSSTSQAAKISRYRVRLPSSQPRTAQRLHAHGRLISAPTPLRLSQRIIVLTGPAGVGKTACIKAVADEMDCELVEWAEGFEEWGMSGGDSGACGRPSCAQQSTHRASAPC